MKINNHKEAMKAGINKSQSYVRHPRMFINILTSWIPYNLAFSL